LLLPALGGSLATIKVVKSSQAGKQAKRRAYTDFSLACNLYERVQGKRIFKTGSDMKLEITLIIAAAATLLNLWLAIRVGRVRTANKVSVGDGGNEMVTRRMRAHANFVEYTPFFLILLALVELAWGSNLWLWGVAILFIVGRLAHAFGMDGNSKLRMFGIMSTLIVLLGMTVYALVIAYSGASFAGELISTSVNA
jgi:uncharacterized membrane protein YecN with MAPEG domain